MDKIFEGLKLKIWNLTETKNLFNLILYHNNERIWPILLCLPGGQEFVTGAGSLNMELMGRAWFFWMIFPAQQHVVRQLPNIEFSTIYGEYHYFIII